ncbi:DEAD/DEAH box helicase family protein [Aurantimicrobium minutum]|uniref:DEAD/DEAH box helicase family protein n=1 Tax=Aurantimicrobium minutum TaxID=708131 RepID=UPI002474DF52|nr:DEAD/DEAH box helicase family protein [Aurantimicrobium minutum]MDH6536537.1 hypothetical protein [Aurantimicrobium minutum]
MSNFIYAYTHSGNQNPWKRNGGQEGEFWVKVGQTKHSGLDRVKQQLITAFPGLKGVTVLFHSEEAQRPDGSAFTDTDVHNALANAGIVRAGGEWFEATPEEVRGAVVSLQTGLPFSATRTQKFGMRPEQKDAVKKTASYFRKHEGSQPKFLWNAKMRFGKTFTTYQLAKELDWSRVLVLTYKPAVRSAWRDDLLNHVDFADWRFIDSAVPTEEADKILDSGDPFVWFASFQDVTGRDSDGNPKPKNQSLHLTDWDCIVIDEFHYGAGTTTAKEIYDPQDKEEAAYAQMINRAVDQESETSAEVLIEPDFGLRTKFHLHLSGTPFKAIANGDYAEDQILNWTYIDEQREKSNWGSAAGPNPYIALPQMQMYTYSMSSTAEEFAEDGEFNGFDLNTYFKAKKVGSEYFFERPNDVLAFLDLIRGKKQLKQGIVDGTKPPFPYESEKFKEAVEHAIWFMPDVASCEAMAELLKKDPYFSSFVIYVAAGTKAGIGANALPPLRKAMKEGIIEGKAGSITLSCGKLMTGVTVPEWTSIFMLRSLRAPESYFQAAFRVQSPWVESGHIKKNTCYVFEFDPNRALGLVALYGTELSNNSNQKDVTQRVVLGELINFLPIFAIDGGIMEKLNADSILEWAHGGITSNSLARKWRSTDLYNLNGVTMERLLDDADLLAELEQIEDFRNIREEAEKIVSSSKKLQNVKREGAGKAAERKPKSEIAEKRKSIRDKLKKVSAKVLIFMYLTDFREERLMHVVESLDTELFLRSTGLSLEGFRKLNKVGVFNESQMNDAIQKYRYFEKRSIESFLIDEIQTTK